MSDTSSLSPQDAYTTGVGWVSDAHTPGAGSGPYAVRSRLQGAGTAGVGTNHLCQIGVRVVTAQSTRHMHYTMTCLSGDCVVLGVRWVSKCASLSPYHNIHIYKGVCVQAEGQLVYCGWCQKGIRNSASLSPSDIHIQGFFISVSDGCQMAFRQVPGAALWQR